MIPILGHENYLICRTGKVFNNKTGKELKLSLNENGYLYANLWKNGKTRSFSVHRLVAQHYIPNPQNKPFVNHIDANRANPHVDNLEWCTQAENVRHAYHIGNLSQKSHFDGHELDWLLKEFISGRTMTDLADTMGVGLSRMTINLRNRAIATGQVKEFEAELSTQKRARNIAANANKKMAVHQLDEFGFIIATYPSLTAAARALGKSTCGPISNVLNPENPQKIGYGFQWKYA